MKNNPITIFGEVLFDHFPDGSKVLGGAPFNVAWHLQAFGQQPQFISRVGDDSSGNQIRSAMHAWGMALHYLQEDVTYPTGQVQVSILQGEPTYAILPDQAYDHIETQGVDNLSRTGILYHGTLVARSSTSRQTLATLKASHQGNIFVDVNLRQPWWDKAEVFKLLKDANWVKLNSQELHLLQNKGNNLSTDMERFLLQHKLEGLIVTRGEKGAIALNAIGEFFSVAPNASITVVDTVGAGDAFTAVVLLGIQLGWPLPETLARAQAFASAVTERRGATVNNLDFYQSFISSWQLI